MYFFLSGFGRIILKLTEPMFITLTGCGSVLASRQVQKIDTIILYEIVNYSEVFKNYLSSVYNLDLKFMKK